MKMRTLPTLLLRFSDEGEANTANTGSSCSCFLGYLLLLVLSMVVAEDSIRLCFLWFRVYSFDFRGTGLRVAVWS